MSYLVFFTNFTIKGLEVVINSSEKRRCDHLLKYLPEILIGCLYKLNFLHLSLKIQTDIVWLFFYNYVDT